MSGITAHIGMYLRLDADAAGNPIDNAQVWSIDSVYPILTLDRPFLGTSGTYTVVLGWTVPGKRPRRYEMITISRTQLASNQFVLENLAAGVEYTARISACNSVGCGIPHTAFPKRVSPIQQRSSEPVTVHVVVESADTIRILWTHPFTNGGDVISHYRVAWDQTRQFSLSAGSSLHYVRNPMTYCQVSPCETFVWSLTRGSTYFVRVFAYNSFGYSQTPGEPSPLFVIPTTTPSPPKYASLSPKRLYPLSQVQNPLFWCHSTRRTTMEAHL